MTELQKRLNTAFRHFRNKPSATNYKNLVKEMESYQTSVYNNKEKDCVIRNTH